jgi:hypothetical protein
VIVCSEAVHQPNYVLSIVRVVRVIQQPRYLLHARSVCSSVA